MTKKPYQPRSKKVEEMLNLAMREIQAVPYEVTARWAFYQIVQNYGASKDDYRAFLSWTSKARKTFWNGWRPNTLVDDTREINDRDWGYLTGDAWIRSQEENECTLRALPDQENYVLVLFEAAAMRRQFDYYLDPLRVDSSPMQGDCSIPHKWNIAKKIDRVYQELKKPVVVIYFGDYDPKGMSIPRSAMKDIWRWKTTPELGRVLSPHITEDSEIWTSETGKFTWVRKGLFLEQAQEMDLTENPEKPDTYQWEALSDEQAGELIRESVLEYWDQEAIEALEEREDETSEKWRKIIEEALK